MQELFMPNITVIFTHHSELGKCNAEELYQIIDALGPEVIFEELPNDLHHKFYKGPQLPYEPPEVKSIKKYLLSHDIQNIPVDINPNQNLRRAEIDYMFNFFKQYHFYRDLEEEQVKAIEQDGFAFLNSKKSMELFEEKMILEERLMNAGVNKIQLISIRKLFYEEQNVRESEMLKNIYSFSKQSQYSNALFFIGSGHQKSIIEKIEKYKTQQPLNLNWTFYKPLV